MRAIFIDVVARDVREVDITNPDSLDEAYKLIGCDMVEAVNVPRSTDAIYVDEEGLLKPQENFFFYEGTHQPLAGNGLIVGTNYSTGDTVAAKTTLEEATAKVRFMSRAAAREYAEKHNC